MSWSWTENQRERALAEGWRVFNNCIERNVKMGRFDSDAAAQAYVAIKAINGDALARAAWEEIAYQHAVLDAAQGDSP